MVTAVEGFFRALQATICDRLTPFGSPEGFSCDVWSRPEGGGGVSRVVAGGAIEKGGVMFSAVEGTLDARAAGSLNIPEGNFYATGVSIVLHPANPFSPIIHMNVRFFQMDSGIWWFGGGIDLTPHYIDPDDAIFFHCRLKAICDRHHPTFYPRFKTWADDYFFLPHRQETRGIGGIFFDRLTHGIDETMNSTFDFVREVGESFCDLYVPMLEKTRNLPFDEDHRKWQLLRRGRYVEFNLVWDKGTKFGLETNGRTESILVSMPPEAAWVYNVQPKTDSKEAQTLLWLKKGVDWSEGLIGRES